MYEGISETSSTTTTVSAEVTAEVQAAFGSGSATLSTEWSVSFLFFPFLSTKYQTGILGERCVSKLYGKSEAVFPTISPVD